MRYLAAAMVLCTGAAVLAQDYPLFSGDDLDEAMKGVGRQFSLLTRMVEVGDFEEAKVRVTRAREQLSPTITFWRKNDRDDAVGMVRDATGRLDDLDVVLSELTIDPAAVSAALSAVDAACQTCHAAYREPDPTAADTFRLRRWSGG